jgi:hypothetical protein
VQGVEIAGVGQCEKEARSSSFSGNSSALTYLIVFEIGVDQNLWMQIVGLCLQQRVSARGKGESE